MENVMTNNSKRPFLKKQWSLLTQALPPTLLGHYVTIHPPPPPTPFPPTLYLPPLSSGSCICWLKFVESIDRS